MLNKEEIGARLKELRGRKTLKEVALESVIFCTAISCDLAVFSALAPCVAPKFLYDKSLLVFKLSEFCLSAYANWSRSILFDSLATRVEL